MHDVAAPPERLGSRSDLRSPWTGVPGLLLAMRVCRDGDRSLAHLFKRVPAEYVAEQSWIGTRERFLFVECPCGGRGPVGEVLEDCAGGCGRMFVADRDAVWSVKLPEQEADDA